MLRRLSQKIRIDQITGLFTYEYIFVVIEYIIKYRKNNELPFGFLLCDANNLKEINDTFGHVTGDNALAQIAKSIRVSVRNDGLDLLEKNGYFSSLPDIVARGSDRGDEFIIILPNCNSNMMQLVVEKIKANIKINIEETKGMDLAIGSVISNEIELPEIVNDDILKKYILDLKKIADERMYNDKRKMKSLMPIEKKINSLVSGIKRISGDFGYNLSNYDDYKEFRFLLDEALQHIIVNSNIDDMIR